MKGSCRLNMLGRESSGGSFRVKTSLIAAFCVFSFIEAFALLFDFSPTGSGSWSNLLYWSFRSDGLLYLAIFALSLLLWLGSICLKIELAPAKNKVMF